MTARAEPTLQRDPLYRQVAARLRDRLRRDYRPGDYLPAEAALAKGFGVSIMTVREALSALAQDGLVARRHGKGTEVLARGETRHVAIVADLDAALGGVGTVPALARRLRARLAAAGVASRLYLVDPSVPEAAADGSGHPAPGSPGVPTASSAAAAPDTATAADGALRGALEAAEISAMAVLGLEAGPGPSTLFTDGGPPTVGLSRACGRPVLLDLADLVQSGVGYLTARGCRRLLCLGATPELPALAVQATAALELRPQTRVVAPGSGQAAAAFRAAWADPATRPDGLLVADEAVFPELALEWLALNLRLDRDLRVICQSQRGSATFGPLPVARLELDPDLLAAALADGLLAALAGHPRAAPRLLQPTFVPAPRPPAPPPAAP